jgi:hypothetical protein
MLYVACRSGSSQADHEQKHRESPKRDIRKKPPSSFQDSLVIKSRSVVFFEPDSLQMEKIKLVNEKMIFESLSHDCFYQMQHARNVLEKDWQGLRVVFASKNRWLIFRKSSGADSSIDLNKVNNICGIFLFDPQKNPVRIDMTNIESQLGFYFRSK